MADPQIKQVGKVIGISSIVALLPVLYAVQEYSDGRYVMRGETITLAQADNITAQLSDASTRAMENSQKLDRLLLDQARRDVWDAEDRLSRAKDNKSATEIRDAEKRLQQCREYYDCLANHSSNCGLLRGI